MGSNTSDHPTLANHHLPTTSPEAGMLLHMLIFLDRTHGAIHSHLLMWVGLQSNTWLLASLYPKPYVALGKLHIFIQTIRLTFKPSPILHSPVGWLWNLLSKLHFSLDSDKSTYPQLQSTIQQMPIQRLECQYLF